MPKAIANPEELRQFAHVLKQTIDQLRGAKADVQAQFQQLHEHWRDEKYHRFQNIFTESMRHLDRFFQDAEIYINHLHRKAELLERYLQHRY
jgi:uncharacterized protein YukE